MNIAPIPQQEEKNQFLWWAWFKSIGTFCSQLIKSLHRTSNNEVSVSSASISYIPTVTANDGTPITNYTTNYCSYTRTGRMVTFSGQITIWVAGAAAGKGMFVSLPVPSVDYCLGGVGREISITGHMCQCTIFASLTDLEIYTYSNSSPIVNNYVVLFSITYPTAQT